MIIKSIPHKKLNFQGVLEYMFAEHTHPAPDGTERFVWQKNMTGSENIREMTIDYLSNESLRIHERSNVNRLYHEVISFHPDSKPTKEQMLDILDQYGKMRGNAKMVAVPHYESKGGNMHLHIMVSALEVGSGRANRLTKENYKNLRKTLNEFQQERYPELSASFVDYDKTDRSRISDKEHKVIQRTGTSVKQGLRKRLKDLLSISSSMQEFQAHLKEEGIRTYDRRGQFTGVLSEGGKKFRLSSLIQREDLQRIKAHSQREAYLIEEQKRSFEMLRKKNEKDRVALENSMIENWQEWRLER